jgi:type II secretory pathway pseudopilin PulG
MRNGLGEKHRSACRAAIGRRVADRRRATGFTLLEILIATTITMLMLLALTEGFKRISDSMTEGRARLDMGGRLRGVTAILRSDLQGLTLRPQPPSGVLGGSGYLKYYDGPLNDFSATLYDPNNNLASPSTGEQIPSSRFGDVDDILMFTARATGEWFRGRVPRALIVAGGGGTPTAADWNTTVIIASQYAEIVYFMLPVPATDAGLDASGQFLAGYIDRDNNGLPDQYRLYRRVLLIRPDLNIDDTANMPAGEQVADYTLPVLGPLRAEPYLGNPMTGMARVHQLCDLSLRRVPSGRPNTPDYVAANSLEDLTKPENRFAHCVLPVPGSQASTSMPILALTPTVPIGAESVDLPGIGDRQRPAMLQRSGFLHPAFTLGGDRLGQDILLGSCIGFDVRGYDPQVALHLSGPELSGRVGSADLVLSPNDPGYALGPGLAVAGRGEFVDMAWGPRVRRSRAQMASLGGVVGPVATESLLSGLDAAGNFQFSLFRSGLLVRRFNLYQPCYDSWSRHYASDDYVQAELSSLGESTVWIDGMRRFNFSMTGDVDLQPGNLLRPYLAIYRNAGIDGIDNDGLNGPDDIGEQEALAPVAGPLAALSVTVRIEDESTEQIQQMTLVHDLQSR